MNTTGLNDSQRNALRKGRFHKLDDILLTPFEKIAKRCQLAPLEVERIVHILSNNVQLDVKTLGEYYKAPDTFTTADQHLDGALGGGIKTGMLWEIVGESGAGKTQLALHLSLAVQLPEDLGGLSGSACYLTTSSKLATARLVELRDSHPILSSEPCGLEHVHTMSCPNVPYLIQVLSTTLPAFITSLSNKKPVKLVVIDAIGELFHSTNKTTKDTLTERSRNITQISALLHSIASTHNVAIVVLNEVVDAFDRGYIPSDQTTLSYSEQARWFSKAHTVPGEDKKEASLGFVWANSVNARIQMSRTGRRRYIDNESLGKRRRLESNRGILPERASEDDTTLIRRLSVIFSAVALPASVDYIVVSSGLFVIPDESTSAYTKTIVASMPPLTATDCPLASQIAPLDRGFAADEDDGDAHEPSADAMTAIV